MLSAAKASTLFCPTQRSLSRHPSLLVVDCHLPHRSQSSRVSVRCHHRFTRVYATTAPLDEKTMGDAQPVWIQKTVTLKPYRRGCHVVTRELISQLGEVENMSVGLANFFIQHTSASLTINENASPDVPLDLNDSLDRLVPDGDKMRYRHDDEGPDDMPAHVKSSLMGASLTIPISNGRLALGTWQGLYLNEHRDYGGSRHVVVTIQGQIDAKRQALNRTRRA